MSPENKTLDEMIADMRQKIAEETAKKTARKISPMAEEFNKIIESPPNSEKKGTSSKID